MPEYTTTEAAAILETARRNVQNYCKRHGLKKFGREYVVTQVDIEAMKLELGKVGRKKTDPISKVIGNDPSEGVGNRHELPD